jgi:hypothetical protein
MTTDKISAFRNSCHAITVHPLLRAIDWYADCAQSYYSLSMDFGADGFGYPRLTVDWRDTPAEVRAVAEHAGNLYSQRFVVTNTVRKLRFGINALSECPIIDHDGLTAIEYHAESYFIRAAALGEQVVRLAAWALRLPIADEGRIDQVVRAVKGTMPNIDSSISELHRTVSVVRARRNEAAHESTFSDERLEGLRGILSPSEALGFQPWEQHLEVVTRYREEFLAGAVDEMTAIAQCVCTVFDHLVPVINLYSSAELARQEAERELPGC